MSCDKCRQLTSGTPIKVATDLRRAIGKVTEALEHGILRYEGAGEFGEPFPPLSKGEHWGDFVSNYFSCVFCGQLFHLYAETYHGAGGAFEKVETIREHLQVDATEGKRLFRK